MMKIVLMVTLLHHRRFGHHLRQSFKGKQVAQNRSVRNRDMAAEDSEEQKFTQTPSYLFFGTLALTEH